MYLLSLYLTFCTSALFIVTSKNFANIFATIFSFGVQITSHALSAFIQHRFIYFILQFQSSERRSTSYVKNVLIKIWKKPFLNRFGQTKPRRIMLSSTLFTIPEIPGSCSTVVDIKSQRLKSHVTGFLNKKKKLLQHCFRQDFC